MPKEERCQDVKQLDRQSVKDGSHSSRFLAFMTLSRESMVMMARPVFLEKLAHVAKLVFQDSQETREALDQR